SRCVETIGAGARVRLQARDRLVDIGPAHQEALRAPNQQRVARFTVDRLARRADPGDRRVQTVQRLRGITRRVLDRETGYARLDSAADALSHTGRLMREASLEIGIDRQV